MIAESSTRTRSIRRGSPPDSPRTAEMPGMIVAPMPRGSAGVEKSKTPTNFINDARPAQHWANGEPKHTKLTTASSVPSRSASSQPTSSVSRIEALANSPDVVRASPWPSVTVIGTVLFQPSESLPQAPAGKVIDATVPAVTPAGRVGAASPGCEGPAEHPASVRIAAMSGGTARRIMAES